MAVRIVGGIVLLYLLVLAITTLLGRGPSPVSAVPQPPHVFFGEVSAGGSPVGSGVTIETRINNVIYSQRVTDPDTGATTQSTFTHAVDAGGFNYGTDTNFQVCADDTATTPVEGGVDLDIITFFVNGVQATPTAIFTRGSVTELDLSISSLGAAKGASATGSSAACTTLQPTPTVAAGPPPPPPSGGGPPPPPPAAAPPPPPAEIIEVTPTATPPPVVQEVIDTLADPLATLQDQLDAISGLENPDDQAQALAGVAAADAGAILGELSVTDAVAIIQAADTALAASVIAETTAADAAAIVTSLIETADAAAAAAIFSEVVDQGNADNAADIFVAVVQAGNADDAGEIFSAVVDAGNVTDAADIVSAAVDAGNASEGGEIFTAMVDAGNTDAAAVIVTEVVTAGDADDAADVVETMTAIAAADIFEEIAVAAVAAEIVDEIALAVQASDILAEVEKVTAGAILEETGITRVTEIVDVMELR